MNQRFSSFILILLIQQMRHSNDNLKFADIASYLNTHIFDAVKFRSQREANPKQQFAGWSKRPETEANGTRDSAWVRSTIGGIIREIRAKRIVSDENNPNGITKARRDTLVGLLTLNEALERGKSADNFRSIVEYLPANLSLECIAGTPASECKSEINRLPGNMFQGGCNSIGRAGAAFPMEVAQ
jgi:hypothetical protein